MGNLAGRRTAWMTVAVQGAITLTITGALWLLWPIQAFSAFAGGIIATLANAIAARRVFVAYRAQEPGKLVAGFYSAEIQKFFVTGAMFAGAFKWLDPLSVGALFGAYLLVHVAPSFLWKFV